MLGNLLLNSTTLLECDVLHIFHHELTKTYCVQFFTNSQPRLIPQIKMETSFHY
jgi:hypothetical protein